MNSYKASKRLIAIAESCGKAYQKGYAAGLKAKPPCACGGEVPIAVEKGRVFRDETGSCDVAIEGWLAEGIEPQGCRVIILPAEGEGA